MSEKSLIEVYQEVQNAPIKSYEMYEYKEHKYLIQSVGQMKHPENGQWLLCVNYTQLGSPVIFTRELNDFSKKFTKVDYVAFANKTE